MSENGMDESGDGTSATNAARLATRLALISEIARMAMSKLEVGDLLTSVADAIHKHFGYYDVSIFLVDQEANECVLVAQSGAYNAQDVEGYRQKVGVGIVGGVAEQGRTVLANDVRQDPRHIVAFHGEERSLSELAVPIRLHDHVVGVINIESQEAQAFDDCDVTSLETLAEQVAQAFANAQLFERTRLLRDLNRSIIDAMSSGICVLDEQSTVLYANPAFGAIIGCNESDAGGRAMTDILPKELLKDPGLEEAIGNALKEKTPGVFTDVRAICAGSEKLLNIRVTPAHMPEGEAVLLMFEDVTETRRAAENLIREKKKLDDVVRAIGAGLALIDKDQNVVWANPTIEEWFGRSRQIVGSKCHEIYCASDTPCTICPTKQCFAAGTGREVDVTLVRADGALRQYHHAAAPVIGPSGQIEQVLKLTLDVTDQTKKVYQLSRMRQFGEMMQGVLELDRLLHFVLTCVTAGQALGFNRAALLLVDAERNTLEGRMGVGPASAEEASRIWSRLHEEAPTLEDLLERYDKQDDKAASALDDRVRSITLSLDDTSNIFVECALGRKPVVFDDASKDPRVPEDFRKLFGSVQLVMAPLIAHDQPIGVVVADNLFTGQPISEEHVELLSMFANQAAIAIENAENYQRVQEEKAHLEQAYRDLADAQDKLIRSERLVAIGRMAAHVAHEIRNPLVTIGGFANALRRQDKVPHETVTKYSKIIVGEVGRLENILARVMDFTKPPRPLLRSASLGQLIRETIAQLRSRIQKHSVKVQLDMPEPDVVLLLDPDQMKQVFINLFQNALDVMRDGGRLSVKVARHDQNAVIVVGNTGEPIHPEDMPNLFEAFFSTKPGGTGLGLAVSQKIVQDHGGDIRAASSLKRGTEFTVTLPLERKTGAPVSYPGTE